MEGHGQSGWPGYSGGGKYNAKDEQEEELKGGNLVGPQGDLFCGGSQNKTTICQGFISTLRFNSTKLCSLAVTKAMILMEAQPISKTYNTSGKRSLHHEVYLKTLLSS